MPNLADAVFFLILLYSVVLGARRGFFKEVVQLLALVAAIYLALALRDTVGGWIAGATGLPQTAGVAAAIVVVWALTFFVVAVVGRLILKKIRGKGPDDRLDEGAEAVADALGGDTTKGPVTLLTDKIAGKRGFYYWSDKLLGTLLGLVKGVATGYILFGILVYSGWDSRLVDWVRSSLATRIYEASIDPVLRTVPEYRIAASVSEMHEVRQAVQDDPAKQRALAEHPELAPLRENPRVEALQGDPELQKAWEARDYQAILTNPKVQALLQDEDLRARLADVDWERVRRDLGMKAEAPPGAADPDGEADGGGGSSPEGDAAADPAGPSPTPEGAPGASR